MQTSNLPQTGMLAENPQADSILPLKKILHCLDQWAPFAWQESYDNAGLILGDLLMVLIGTKPTGAGRI